MKHSFKLKIALSAGVAALALAACGGPAEAPGPATAVTEAAPVAADVDFQAVADAAVADPRRPEKDRAEDARRMPETAIAFMEIAPGMTVIDIEAGGGWYTEMLSYAVGPSGAVIMQNPEGFRSFVGEDIDARLADGRLANVRESYSLFDALDAPDASVDVAVWVQGPHELYFKPNGGSLGDPNEAYAQIFRVLKPGGAFVVIDHAAVAGAPETTGNDLHRIDKAIVLRLADRAGFVLGGESDFLANPDDARDIGVFDPSIRGHTDQFALRFTKPK